MEDRIKTDLKSIRKKANLTQVELAELFGCTPFAIRHWEQGYRKPNNTIMIMYKLLEKHGVNLFSLD